MIDYIKLINKEKFILVIYKINNKFYLIYIINIKKIMILIFLIFKLE